MFNKISKRRLSPLVMVALVFLATITACSKPSGPVADVVYTNGHVYTMDQEMTRAEAVATLGGDIMFVGSSEDAMKLAGENTKTVDLAGRMLLPGFIDAHGHFPGSGATALSADLNSPPLGEIKNIRELQQALRKQLATPAPGEWVSGLGYDDTLLAEKTVSTMVEVQPWKLHADALEPLQQPELLAKIKF